MKYSQTIYIWVKIINTLFIVFISIFSCDTIIAQDTNVEITLKAYIAHYAEGTITIDGLANEDVWHKADYSDEFIDIEGIKKPKYNTRFKMLWDEQYVYFFAELQEPHVWGTLKQKDTIVYHNNDFEIFIDPDGDGHNYYEFEINALNTLWDLFLTKPYREETTVLNDWDANGLKSAVHIDGTLNNPNDKDNNWSIEVAIPIKVFKISYFEKSNLATSFWRVNFSRVQWDFQLDDGRYVRKKDQDGKVAREYNWVWSPQGVINMHRPETWGYVYFSPKNGNKTDFVVPKDEKIKWNLFKLYNAQKAYYKKNNKWSESIKDLNVKVLVNNMELNPLLENHSTGWNISIKSPFSNKILTIREDGELISK